MQAFDISGEQECRAMHKLIGKVYGNSLRLDAGFNDRELVKKIAELGMTPYVFPKSNNNLNSNRRIIIRVPIDNYSFCLQQTKTFPLTLKR